MPYVIHGNRRFWVGPRRSPLAQETPDPTPEQFQKAFNEFADALRDYDELERLADSPHEKKPPH